MSESNEPTEAEKWMNAGAFLTDDELLCLHGKKIDHESQKRYRIRYKTLGALNDLFEVNSGLSNKHVKKVFEAAGNVHTKGREGHDIGTTRDTAVGERDVLPGREGELSAIVALGCRGHYLNGVEPEQFISQVIAPGIRKGLGDVNGIHPNRVSVDIEVDITVNDDLSELAERLEQEGPTAVTEEQAFLLYQSDRIEPTEYTDIIESKNE